VEPNANKSVMMVDGASQERGKQNLIFSNAEKSDPSTDEPEKSMSRRRSLEFSK
jgi:hypothetical protein